MLERRKITSIVVVNDDQRVQGVVHLHHLWLRIVLAPMSDYALLAVLFALLLGLVAGKAWGALQAPRRPLGGSAPASRDAPLHARPQLPRGQSGRSGGRGTDPGHQHGHRCPRNPDDSGQPVSPERTGRPGDHGSSGAAPAAGSPSHRAPHVHSVSTTSMAASSTARSKHFRKSHLDPRNRYAS